MIVKFIKFSVLALVVFVQLIADHILRHSPYLFWVIGLTVGSLTLLGIGRYSESQLVLLCAGVLGFCTVFALLADIVAGPGSATGTPAVPPAVPQDRHNTINQEYYLSINLDHKRLIYH